MNGHAAYAPQTSHLTWRFIRKIMNHDDNLLDLGGPHFQTIHFDPFWPSTELRTCSLGAPSLVAPAQPLAELALTSSSARDQIGGKSSDSKIEISNFWVRLLRLHCNPNQKLPHCVGSSRMLRGSHSLWYVLFKKMELLRSQPQFHSAHGRMKMLCFTTYAELKFTLLPLRMALQAAPGRTERGATP